jgi:DNA processing protein
MLPEFPIDVIHRDVFPKLLLEMPKPPNKLYIRGRLPKDSDICLTVIGSRKGTQYGREVTEMLIGGLSGYPISIVSGLAIGIDSIAHETAIKVGLHTVAFPGSGLSDNCIYPPSSRGLAERILKSGGCLLSEYPPNITAMPWMFPQRNKLMAGMSKVTLLIEAGERSGTLITAQNALDFNRDVLVVPGSIFSPLSVGLHKLMEEGAAPVFNSKDILNSLGFNLP